MSHMNDKEKPPISRKDLHDPFKDGLGSSNRKTVGTENDKFWQDRNLPTPPPPPETLPEDEESK